MITSGPNTFLFRDASVLVVCSKPGRCACGRSSTMFKNVDGQTRCLWCAPTECAPSDDGPDALAAFQKAIV